jgi:cell division protein FtsB
MSEKNGKNMLTPQDDPTPCAEADRKLGVSMLARVALAVAVITSLTISISSLMKYNQLEAQKARLEEQLKTCNQEIAEAQYLINAPMDDEYIAKVARQRWNLYFPDEVIYYGDVNE